MRKSIVILIHAGYWITYCMLIVLLLVCLQLGTNLNKYPQFANIKFWIFLATLTLVPGIAGFYSYYGIVFTSYLARQKWLSSFAVAFVCSLAAALIGFLFTCTFYWLFSKRSFLQDGWSGFAVALSIMAIIATLNGLVGLVMKGFFSWFADIKIKQELTKKNFETELALVKSQLDPHFLFNTINNIDVLISKDPEQASAYLNKLSDIMRFMLYETHQQCMPLAKELEYIHKYISLQKIRFSNPNFVCVTTNTFGETLLPPLLFIPFIENAFKFALPLKDRPGINIIIEQQENQLAFTCINSIDTAKVKNQSNGLGNQLMKRRLELLFPNKHKINIINTPNTYQVNLAITLP